ncbi:MAG: hypothetical protein V1707_01360 [bacterium]
MNTEKIKLFHVDYPENIVMWNKEIDPSKKLKIINPGDFPVDSILESLGLKNSSLKDSFGITDEDELKARGELIRFFTENPKVMETIGSMQAKAGMPVSQQEFLDFNDPIRQHNPYWQTIHGFIQAVESAQITIPERLKVIVDALKDSLPLEASEKEMANEIADKLQHITFIEGLLSFGIIFGYEGKSFVGYLDLREEKQMVHGYQKYSQSLDEIRYQKEPDWTTHKINPLNWLGIGWITNKIIKSNNQQKKKRAYQAMVLRHVENVLIQDIEQGLKSTLNSLDWKKLSTPSKLVVHLYFSYGENGLKFRVYGFDILKHEGLPQEKFEMDSFKGYTLSQSNLIHEARVSYTQEIDNRERLQQVAFLIRGITVQQPNFFHDYSSIPSPGADRKYRWFAVSNLYHSDEFSEVYEAVTEHRIFFGEYLSQSQEIIRLASLFHKKALELGTKLVYPTFVGKEQHVVSFDTIYPIHLLKQVNSKEVVPIKNLPSINGQIIGLTGAHAGGKTVTALSVTDNIFLAQSGLPLFGEGDFTMNIKKVLGTVFIERGTGSTCEMLVDKIAALFKGIKGVDGRQVLLVLDELGTGTQEASGFELGRDVLAEFSRRKISVLFSTQILGLAEYVVNNLKGQCFKLNSEHQLMPGISGGGLSELIERKGLKKYLNN